ncbi:hypothetical protein K493DRAFT_295388 [Basidiobolus meristosporus CBS 931.73]|uniref:Uncharacterized protein n=1 Tax=Basidiobolus meristosporus CBS 931.73 TaxID=1314790 RepID=A0A1Y1ZC43_9FUNG|nr:hypothetical protein K493DRAFT_295388 [Basidiobolus meristosporus CBS 931.73]|eukprot:ORY07756.1 hypothetical protein K493DRAFT_295388 [Basidiobolus meristosporus CBS 931.73]
MRYLFLLTSVLSCSLLVSCQSSLEVNKQLEKSSIKTPITYLLGGLLSIVVVVLAIMYFAYRGWKNLLNRRECQRRIRLALNDPKLYPSVNATELPPYSFRASQVTLPSNMVEAISEKTLTSLISGTTYASQERLEVIIDNFHGLQQSTVVPPPPVYNA